MSTQRPVLSNPTPAQLKAAEAVALHELWRRGHLNFKRHAGQKQIGEAIKSASGRQYFLLCSRRYGKSYELVLQAIETCIQKPGSRILFCAPHAKDASDLASDLAAKILEDCPKSLAPVFNSNSKEMVFSRTGSIIRFKGVNDQHAQFLRGGAADLVILDECALMTDLRHLLFDVVLPMTMTTNGKILLASTPPRTPSHFSTKLYEDLSGQGCTKTFTLRDAPHIPEHVKLEYLIAVGEKADRVEGILRGELEPETTTARREYFCEFCTDSSQAVVPEFDAECRKATVKEWKRPAYFDAYTSADLGFVDRTGLLFAYWDFVHGKLVIEDEALLHGKGSRDIAEVIKQKEAALWEDQKPLLRVIDAPPMLVSDMYQLHGLVFTPAQKQDAIGGVNFMRQMIQAREIIINPRCVNLQRQLVNAIWNNRATDFARPDDNNPETNIDGHYDLVSSLRYMTRHVLKTRNPYPGGWFNMGGQGGPAGDYESPKSRRRREARRFDARGDTPLAKRLRKRS